MVKTPFYIYVFVRSRTSPRDVKKPDRIGLFGANIFFIRIGWCANRDSNPGPTGYEPVALTN